MVIAARRNRDVAWAPGIAAWCAGALLWVLAGSVAPAVAAAPEEMRVQAAYVMNFIRYTRWPDAAGEALDVVVVGTSNDAAVLRESASRAGAVQGRLVNVRHLPFASVAPPADEASSAVRASLGRAHVVYVGASHYSWARTVASATAGRPVLTVGARHGFLREGGMIELYLQQGTVRFDVNAPVIKASPLDVSARLLVLARPAGRG